MAMAVTRRRQLASLGNSVTTRVRRLISLLARSIALLVRRCFLCWRDSASVSTVRQRVLGPFNPLRRGVLVGGREALQQALCLGVIRSIEDSPNTRGHVLSERLLRHVSVSVLQQIETGSVAKVLTRKRRLSRP